MDTKNPASVDAKLTRVLLARGWQASDTFDHYVGYRYGTDLHERGKSCRWESTTESVVRDETNYQFDGTDHSGMMVSHIKLDHVRCSCGGAEDVALVLEGRLSELLPFLLED